MLGWYGKVVGDKTLQGMSKYKYSAVDKSPISNYILQPYWSACVHLFPMWMAPNLITLLGFFMVLAGFIVMLVYIPDLESQAPSWVYYFFAAALWIYSTFDNVDGKQARRTGSSSPLGELFDHGIDALNCTTGGFLQVAALGLGHSPEAFLVICLTIVNFFFATWETYYTGTMYLGYINGPTEGILLSCASIIATGYFGVQFWHQPLSAVINLQPIVDLLTSYNLPIYDLLTVKLNLAVLRIMVLLALTTQIPGSISRVFWATNSGKKGGKNFVEAMFNLIPYSIYLWTGYVWFHDVDSMSQQYAVLFLLGFGITSAKIITMILLSHVTHDEYPVINATIFPWVMGAFLVTWHHIRGTEKVFKVPEVEIFYLLVVVVGTIVEYFLWCIRLVEQFCEHLQISCFSITKKPQLKSTPTKAETASPARRRSARLNTPRK